MSTESIRSAVLEFCLRHTKGAPMRELYLSKLGQSGATEESEGAMHGLVVLYRRALSREGGSFATLRHLIQVLDHLADDKTVASFLVNELESLGNRAALTHIREDLRRERYSRGVELSVDNPAELMALWLERYRLQIFPRKSLSRSGMTPHQTAPGRFELRIACYTSN